MASQSSSYFRALVLSLKQFKLKCAPFNEREIEEGIEQHLKARHFPVKRQIVKGKDRFDLTVGKFIIEAKLIGSISVAEQLDRYSFFCDGIILVCWKASKPLKQLFADAKSQCKIPVELVEINKNCDVV